MTLTANRLLLLVAFLCALLAAFVFAWSIPIGPALAWLAGAFAAWFLAQAVP